MTATLAKYAATACMLALLTGCAQSLFYFPDKVVYGTPQQAGLRFEEVAFPSKDGTRLTGWFIPASGYSDARGAKATVIHFHGNAQNMTAHWHFAKWLPKRGYNLFVFDYRGYGASQGSPGPRGLFEDSVSALDYVRSRPDVNPDKLILLGQSLGGANAIAAAGAGNRQGIRAIVIESAFYSYSSVASDKISWAGALMDDTYSPANYITRLAPIPLLLLHGTDDPVVPFHHAIWLYYAAHEPRRLVMIEGGKHVQAFTPAFGTTYMDLVSAFLEDVLKSEQDIDRLHEVDLGKHHPEPDGSHSSCQ